MTLRTQSHGIALIELLGLVCIEFDYYRCHNGEKIHVDEGGTSEHYRISKKELELSITLLNITYEMGGRYACRADEVETSTLLEVHGRPIIDKGEGVKTIDVDAGDNIIFHLKLMCLPEPDIQLLFNGTLLPANFNTHIDVMETAASVCMRSVGKADRGLYTVRVFNEHGEDSQDFNVYARGNARR